jgi:hypothetical protein
MLALRIFEIVFPIFAIIGVGILYGRRHNPEMKVVNTVNMDVFVPMLMFTVLVEQTADFAAYHSLLLGAILVVFASGAVAIPIARAIGVNPKTFCPPMMFSNVGNLGLPLMVLAFGKEALPAAVIMFLASTGIHFSFGMWLLSGQNNLFVLLRTPLIVAVILAAAVNLLNITIPEAAMIPITMMSKVSIPLMLFSLGTRLAYADLKEWRVGLVAGIASPIVGVALVFIVSQFLTLTPLQQGVLFLFGAQPPAVLNYIFSERFNIEPAKVAAIVVIGNALTVISLPLALAYVLPRFG